MKILFAYYSLTGNCRELARRMAEAVNGDTLAIEPAEQPIPDASLANTLKGGFMSLAKKSSELKPINRKPADYDLVVVGGPVWAWNISPPIRAFLDQTDWQGVTTALFCMSGGPQGGTLKSMRKAIEQKGGKVLETARFQDLRKGNPEKTRADALKWIRGIVANRGE